MNEVLLPPSVLEIALWAALVAIAVSAAALLVVFALEWRRRSLW